MSEVINIKELNERIERESVFVDTLNLEMSKVIVGQKHLVDTLLIGLLSGWIANMIVRGGGVGLLVNLIVGLIGGLLGGWIFSWFGIIAVGTIGSILTSVAGAVILLWIAALIRPDKGH